MAIATTPPENTITPETGSTDPLDQDRIQDEEKTSKSLPVKVVYFETYEQLMTWLDDAKDLIPYSVKVEDVVCKIGCLWQWLDLNASRTKYNKPNALTA